MERGKMLDEEEIMAEESGSDSGNKLKTIRILTRVGFGLIDMDGGMVLEQDDEIMEEGVSGDSQNKSTSPPTYADIKQVYPLIRDRNPELVDDYKITLSTEFFLDPPEFASLLEFAVELERERINQLTHDITTGGQLEIEKCTKELAEMIKTDPRLAVLLEEHFYELLVSFLHDEHNPVLQVNAIKILIPVVAYTGNREMVIKYINASIIVNLLRSKDCRLMVQALRLLRSIVLAFPHCPKIKTMIEEALESITYIFTKYPLDSEVLISADSVDFEVLCIGGKTLAAICQEHPQLPPDKLELALIAIRRLFRYESFEIVSCACDGFVSLCDGNKAVVVQHDYLSYVIGRTVEIFDSRARTSTMAGLRALGSIVRWGSDDDIQVIIEKEGLWSLECLLRSRDKFCVLETCWILSNITARKPIFIEALIKHECIDSLVGVIKDYKSDVVKEATWVILNAICRASINQIVCLSKWVKVTCNGKRVNDAEFKNCLGRLQKRQVQSADDIKGLPKLKRPRSSDDIGIYDSDIMFHLSAEK